MLQLTVLTSSLIYIHVYLVRAALGLRTED